VRYGKPTAFLSCSEAFKQQVAVPVRAALATEGVDGIIASLERVPMNADWDPDTKIDKLLEQSDIFVALVTPDDDLADGVFQPRLNVAEEIGRARHLPHLRQRCLVFKEPTARLPSNVNPVYEQLSLESPERAALVIVEQMRVWGVLAPNMGALVDPTGGEGTDVHAEPNTWDERVADLLAHLELGDWDDARRRAYRVLSDYTSVGQRSIIEHLFSLILVMHADDKRLHPATMLYEELGRLDQTLINHDALEVLALSALVPARICAAAILWSMAMSVPGEVPIGILGWLARPSAEDWYVQAPAMAAAKELLLVRPAAAAIFGGLASSGDVEDRLATAVALCAVAEIAPAAVPRELYDALNADPEPEVRERIARLGQLIAGVDPRNIFYNHFSI